MLLSETLLKSSDKFKFVNYRTYKSRRNTSCRGTALLIRNEISHHEIPLSLEQLEATAVIIKIRGENIGIVSLYNSPSIDFYKNDYDKIFRISNTVLCGKAGEKKEQEVEREFSAPHSQIALVSLAAYEFECDVK